MMCWFCFSPSHTTFPPPALQLPDSPTVPTRFRHLPSLLLSSPTRLFLCLLRRPPPVACLHRCDFPPQPSSWRTTWLSPVPRRLLFLLAASMALPGRPPRGRRLKLATPNPEHRGEDACTGKSSPESVSTGDSTNPTFGFRRPQPFPLALILIDPAHPGLTRILKGWHSAGHTGG